METFSVVVPPLGPQVRVPPVARLAALVVAALSALFFGVHLPNVTVPGKDPANLPHVTPELAQAGTEVPMMAADAGTDKVAAAATISSARRINSPFGISLTPLL